MKQDYHTIVLGLGGLGSAALYWLARRIGGDALGLEQFALDHNRGSSQDHSRIIRLSYHSPDYVELAKHAYAAWAEVEEDAGEQLIYRTGGLDLLPAGSPFSLSDYTSSMDAAGVAYERLTAAEVMGRWPQFRLTDDVSALYQPQSGIATPNKSNAAHRRLALSYGATIRDNAPVTAVRPVGDEIEIVAGGVTYRCQRLAVAAGAWTSHVLAHFGRRLHMTVTQEQVTYYRSPRPEDFNADRFPIWIWLDEPCFYGFPVFGEVGPKVAQDVGGEQVTPETRTFAPNPATLGRMEAFLARTIPGILGPPIYTKTCLYDMPPDRNFILCALPEQPNVCLANGAAHSYKFAALIGKVLSELALDGATPHDISPFHIDRPILLEENPVTTFMC
jgi:sarcosine oxidase